MPSELAVDLLKGVTPKVDSQQGKMEERISPTVTTTHFGLQRK